MDFNEALAGAHFRFSQFTFFLRLLGYLASLTLDYGVVIPIVTLSIYRIQFFFVAAIANKKEKKK
jgi:hypothetical protein